jgi:hypothetical protein
MHLNGCEISISHLRLAQEKIYSWPCGQAALQTVSIGKGHLLICCQAASSSGHIHGWYIEMCSVSPQGQRH